MGILGVFGSRRPTLKRSDVQDIQKVATFVVWFIKNDPLVKAVANPSCNIIFSEGYRPLSLEINDPYAYNPNISSLPEWFVTKVFLDLNILAASTKDEFRTHIDFQAEWSAKTLIEAGLISGKYNLALDKEFVYQKEIVKIPEGLDRDSFKVNFLRDCVLGAEIRILAWLYHEFFSEWYQIRPHAGEGLT